MDQKLIGVKVYNLDQPVQTFIQEIKELGVNTVFAGKKLCTKNGFIDSVQQSGIDVFVIWPVFYQPEYLKKHPESYAIDQWGNKAKEDWVEFVCPTNKNFKQYITHELESFLKEYHPNGLSLDFIRHFVYWEKVYPTTNPRSIPKTCFCDRCVHHFIHLISGCKKTTCFLKCLIRKVQVQSLFRPFGSLPLLKIKEFTFVNDCFQEGRNEEIGLFVQAPIKQKQTIEKNTNEIILNKYSTEWDNWRTNTISQTAKSLIVTAKQINPEIMTNIHAVPWSKSDFGEHARSITGQDIADLSEYADYISPMCYAHMVKQSPEWIHNITVELYNKNPKMKIIPSIQVQKEYLEEPIKDSVFIQYLQKAMNRPSSGVVFWSWEALKMNPCKRQLAKKFIKNLNRYYSRLIPRRKPIINPQQHQLKT